MAEFDVSELYPLVEPQPKPIAEINDPFASPEPELDPFAPFQPLQGVNLLDYPDVEPPPKPEVEPEPLLAPLQPIMLALPPLATYPSREALFEAIQSWAKARGYAFTVGKSKRVPNRRQKVYYACDRCPPTPPPTGRVRATQSRGSGCLFSILAVELPSNQGWEVRYRPEA